MYWSVNNVWHALNYSLWFQQRCTIDPRCRDTSAAKVWSQLLCLESLWTWLMPSTAAGVYSLVSELLKVTVNGGFHGNHTRRRKSRNREEGSRLLKMLIWHWKASLCFSLCLPHSYSWFVIFQSFIRISTYVVICFMISSIKQCHFSRELRILTTCCKAPYTFNRNMSCHLMAYASKYDILEKKTEEYILCSYVHFLSMRLSN